MKARNTKLKATKINGVVINYHYWPIAEDVYTVCMAEPNGNIKYTVPMFDIKKCKRTVEECVKQIVKTAKNYEAVKNKKSPGYVDVFISNDGKKAGMVASPEFAYPIPWEVAKNAKWDGRCLPKHLRN